MRELAMWILKSCGGERQIILQAQSIMNSLDDTLPKEEALAKLRALRSACVRSATEPEGGPVEGTIRLNA